MQSLYNGRKMRVIVVGTGAGGATIARALSNQGLKVVIFEAGKELKPFRKLLLLASPLRRTGLLGKENTITRLFPPMNTARSADDLVLIRGITTGGSRYCHVVTWCVLIVD